MKPWRGRATGSPRNGHIGHDSPTCDLLRDAGLRRGFGLHRSRTGGDQAAGRAPGCEASGSAAPCSEAPSGATFARSCAASPATARFRSGSGAAWSASRVSVSLWIWISAALRISAAAGLPAASVGAPSERGGMARVATGVGSADTAGRRCTISHSSSSAAW